MSLDSSLRLQVRLVGTPADARRGVVRVSPATLAALGLREWDAVRLTSTGTGRATGAVVAAAPPGTHPFVLLADAVTMANLGLAEGQDVDLAPGRAAPCTELVLALPDGLSHLARDLAPDTVRLALLGKVVGTGDVVALAPQDVADAGAAPAVSLGRAAVELRAALGEDWRQVMLTVRSCVPASEAQVSMGTVVRIEGGLSTATSATLLPGLMGPSPTAALRGPAVSVAPDPVPAIPAGPPPGLGEPYRALVEWLDLDFHHHEVLDRLGSGRRLGVLVTGPAGSGKVALVRAAAAAVGAQVVHVWGPAIVGGGADGAVARLRSAAGDPGSSAPFVLLIEDVDALAGSDPGSSFPAVIGELRARVAQPGSAVVCTTSRPEACDARLREPGVLEREIAVPLLTRSQRLEVLSALTTQVPLAEGVDLADLASRTPGFVLADLVGLVHEAGVRAAQRDREAVSVTASDFDGALSVTRPSTAEDQAMEAPDMSLDDVGDMADVKAALTEAVLWPLSHPDTFARLGIEPPRGVLLYGPPGCGKTFLVRALAGSGQLTVFPLKGAEVMTKYVGESERGLREVFRRARQAAPSMIFLDEIDALAPRRGQSTDSGVGDRLVATLLTELDGIERLNSVVVVGATNRPDLIDPAVLRPGRLERLVYAPPPDATARAAILRAAARRSPLAADVDLDAVAEQCEGYSAADCAALVREAALTAMRRSMSSAEITAEDMAAALATVRPSLDPLQVASLEAYAASRAAEG